MAYNPNQPRAKDGKWDGAGGASGSHAAGVNNVGKSRIAPNAVQMIRNAKQGVTVSTRGEVPTKGYMVSVRGRTHVLSDSDLKSKAADGLLNDYAAKNRDELDKPGSHIGVWRDHHTGKIYLDVSQNLSNQREAVKAGKAGNQIGIWDVKRKRFINTGGTGD